MFSTSDWWKNVKQLQNSLSLHQDPVIELSEIDKRKNDVLDLFTALKNKPKPVSPPAASEQKQPDVEMKDANAPQSEDAKMD